MKQRVNLYETEKMKDFDFEFAKLLANSVKMVYNRRNCD